MTDLTPEQTSEREAHRRANGEFGEHPHTSPEVHLDDGNGFRDPAYPATVTVTLEQWNDRDEAVPVGEIEFDARAVFDAHPTDAIDPEDSDQDWVFYEAQKAGLADGHNGPFTVHLPEDIDDYITHREENGMTDPYPSAVEGLAAAKLDADMTKRRKAIADAARLLERNPDATTTKLTSELTAGDVLAHGSQRVTVNDISESSAMPGFLMVETDFGNLYLDPAAEHEVEAFA